MKDYKTSENKTTEDEKRPNPSSLSEIVLEYYKSVSRSTQKEFLTANGCFSKQSALDACLAKHDPHYAKVLAQYKIEDKTSAKLLEAARKHPNYGDSPFSVPGPEVVSWKVASCPPSWKRAPRKRDWDPTKEPDEGKKEDLPSLNIPFVSTNLDGNDGKEKQKESLLLEYLDLCQRQNTLLTLHLSRGDQVDGRVRRFDNDGVIFRTDLCQELRKEEGEMDCYLSLTSILDLTPQEPFAML